MNCEGSPQPDRSPDPLKRALRALPQPPVPAHLEARLLATVPAALRISRRRRTVRAAMLVGAAAACVVAAVVWQSRPGDNLPTIPGTGEPQHQEISSPSFDSTGIVARRDDPRLLDEEKLPAFTWPLDESAVLRPLSPIPADLLD